jgi:hypothetical protein
MVANITQVQSPLLNQVLICYHRAQMSELCPNFKTCVTYLYVMILPSILVMRQQHILRIMQGKVSSWETVALKCKVNWHMLLKVLAHFTEGLYLIWKSVSCWHTKLIFTIEYECRRGGPEIRPLHRDLQ